MFVKVIITYLITLKMTSIFELKLFQETLIQDIIKGN